MASSQDALVAELAQLQLAVRKTEAELRELREAEANATKLAVEAEKVANVKRLRNTARMELVKIHEMLAEMQLHAERSGMTVQECFPELQDMELKVKTRELVIVVNYLYETDPEFAYSLIRCAASTQSSDATSDGSEQERGEVLLIRSLLEDMNPDLFAFLVNDICRVPPDPLDDASVPAFEGQAADLGTPALPSASSPVEALERSCTRTAILNGICVKDPDESSFSRALPVLLLNMSSDNDGSFFRNSRFDSTSRHPALAEFEVLLRDDWDDDDSIRMNGEKGYKWCASGDILDGASFYWQLESQQRIADDARFLACLSSTCKSAFVSVNNFDAECDLLSGRAGQVAWSSAEVREMKGVRSLAFVALSRQMLHTGVLAHRGGDSMFELWHSFHAKDASLGDGSDVSLLPPLPKDVIAALYAQRAGMDVQGRLFRKRCTDGSAAPPALALTPMGAAWLEVRQRASAPGMLQTLLSRELEARERSGMPPPRPGLDPLAPMRYRKDGTGPCFSITFARGPHPLQMLLWPFFVEDGLKPGHGRYSMFDPADYEDNTIYGDER